MNKILPIKYPPVIKSYLPISIISSIVEANTQSDFWVMNNFIQLFIPQGRRKLETFPFQDFMYFDQSMFKVNIYTDLNMIFMEETFLENIVKWIEKNNYVIVYADEFYIPNTRFYKKRHILHSQFIYGYDLEIRAFRTMNFSNQTEDIATFEVKFDDVKSAFFSEATYELYNAADITWSHKNTKHKVVIIQMTMNKNETYDQTINKEGILFELKNYCYSINSSNYTSYFTGKLRGTWGIKCYDEIILLLKENPKYIDYRSFHLICEHKLQMKKRLFLFYDDVEFYQQVVDLANKLRIYSIKYNFDFNKKIIEKMIYIINQIKEKDRKYIECLLMREGIKEDVL